MGLIIVFERNKNARTLSTLFPYDNPKIHALYRFFFSQAYKTILPHFTNPHSFFFTLRYLLPVPASIIYIYPLPIGARKFFNVNKYLFGKSCLLTNNSLFKKIKYLFKILYEYFSKLFFTVPTAYTLLIIHFIFA